MVEETSDVIQAVYERIAIEEPRFIGLRPTPAAYRHRLALALPEAGMARPTAIRGQYDGEVGIMLCARCVVTLMVQGPVRP